MAASELPNAADAASPCGRAGAAVAVEGREGMMNEADVTLEPWFPLTRPQRIEAEALLFAAQVKATDGLEGALPVLVGHNEDWCRRVFDRATELLETVL